MTTVELHKMMHQAKKERILKPPVKHKGIFARLFKILLEHEDKNGKGETLYAIKVSTNNI